MEKSMCLEPPAPTQEPKGCTLNKKAYSSPEITDFGLVVLDTKSSGPNLFL